MLDTYGRKYVSPLIGFWVNLFHKLNWTPTQVTMLAFFLGLVAMVAYVLGYVILGVILLWLSGLLDAVDGALARKTGAISQWGTLLDITFDRLVEIGLLGAIAWQMPKMHLPIIAVLCSIILSMTVFLTVGALSVNEGQKSFRYQAGIAERTEGFLFITAMMLVPAYGRIIAWVFAVLILITAFQRLKEAKKILKN